jgi:hypothetical protein
MKWEGGSLTQCKILSKAGNPCRIKVGDISIKLKTKKGIAYFFNADLRKT